MEWVTGNKDQNFSLIIIFMCSTPWQMRYKSLLYYPWFSLEFDIWEVWIEGPGLWKMYTQCSALRWHNSHSPTCFPSVPTQPCATLKMEHYPPCLCGKNLTVCVIIPDLTRSFHCIYGITNNTINNTTLMKTC